MVVVVRLIVRVYMYMFVCMCVTGKAEKAKSQGARYTHNTKKPSEKAWMAEDFDSTLAGPEHGKDGRQAP